jgi:predicted esterase
MEQSELTFEFKARYYQLGEITSNTSECWFVLHGQGQLAQFFIQKFKALKKPGVAIIAPEGLSRYYLNGITGRVGATWMTKENRLMDIDNYIAYLNALYNKLAIPGHVKVTVLGFSQGAATASRWVMDNTINFQRLILWGGIFPPDMDFKKGQHVLKQREVVTINGTTDPFMRDDQFAKMRNLAERLNIKPVEITFEGSHDIDEATLLTLIN